MRGLAGILAFLVFVHHAFVWRQYLASGQWSLPEGRLQVHMGQSSNVALAMALGFLLLDGALQIRDRAGWHALRSAAVRRFALPYLASVVTLFMVVAFASGGTVQVPLMQLAQEAARWLLFGLWGTPDVNGVQATWRIAAGTSWAAAVAAIVFALVPLVALVANKVVLASGLATTMLAVAWLFFNPLPLPVVAALGTGAAVRLAAGIPALQQWARSPAASLAVVAGSGLLVVAFSSGYEPLALGLIAALFLPIGCGNSLFGVLRARPFRALGLFAAGTYFLHGPLLYVALAGTPPGAAPFWSRVALCAVALVALACLLGRPVAPTVRPASERPPT